MTESKPTPKKKQSSSIKVVVSPETLALLAQMAAAQGSNMSEFALRLIGQGLLAEQSLRDRVSESVLRIAQTIAVGAEPERRVAELGREIGSQPAAEGVAMAIETIINAMQAGRDIEIGGVLDQEGWSWKLHGEGVMITFTDDGVRYFVPERNGAFLTVSHKLGGPSKEIWDATYKEWKRAPLEPGEIAALAPYLTAIQEQLAASS